MTTTQIKDKRVNIPNGSGKKVPTLLRAFEKDLSLETLAKIRIKGRESSCFVLSKGRKFKLVFAFECKGIHDSLKHNHLVAAAEAIESGIKDISQGSVVFHMESFSTDSDRQTYLDNLISQTDCIEAKVLLYSEKQRSKELADAGIRQSKRLTIYIETKIDFASNATQTDWSDKAIGQLGKFWGSVKKVSSGENTDDDEYKTLFETGFYNGFLYWEQILANRMGLVIKPLDLTGLWSRVWDRFNTGKPTIEPPQWIEYEDGKIKEIIHNDKHPRSILVQGEGGECRVPVADRTWIKVKDKFIGTMVFAEKPDGFKGVEHQLRFLWNALSKSYVKDTEIFTRIESRSLERMQGRMQDQIKQSGARSAFANEKANVDVNANLRLKRSIEAQEKLIEGSVPIQVASVVFVHRERKNHVDDACFSLANAFPLPCRLIRERDVPWHYWLQSLPISWDGLLSKPYDRSEPWMSNEVAGILPLMKTREVDPDGFELIADEGGSPIKLDFIKKLLNVACFGTTRSGKSVLISGMLTLFLASGYPIVALDYPKPDGTSTFTDYAAYFADRAAYFDIGKESNNIMEIPDLRRVTDLDEREERMSDYKSFLETAILAMVGGNGSCERALVGKALTLFFADPDIQRRYDLALEGGFGSDEWQLMPTLKDLGKFYTKEALDIDETTSPLQRNAREQIELQIDYWLNSKIGNAIGKASSFPTDSQLLVFALRNLSNNDEAALLALSAYSAALRRALSSPKSIFFVDESPILFEYDSIASLIGKLCANGAKAGIRVFLSAQDPNTIMESVAGPKIMQNMNTKLIGRIQEVAVPAFQHYFRYEERMIARNASERFFPQASELYSNWLLDTDGNITYCRYYPSAMQLGIVANNTEEQAARKRYLKKHKNNKLAAYSEFSKAYAHAVRNGLPMEAIG